MTINTGAGNDSVVNYCNSVTINAGDGDDSVRNDYGYDCTITREKVMIPFITMRAPE